MVETDFFIKILNLDVVFGLFYHCYGFNFLLLTFQTVRSQFFLAPTKFRVNIWIKLTKEISKKDLGSNLRSSKSSDLDRILDPLLRKDVDRIQNYGCKFIIS